MQIPDQKIKQILLAGKYVKAEDMKKAEKYARATDTSIADYLLLEGLVNKDLLGEMIAQSFGMFYADLNSKQPNRDQVMIIPEDAAKKYRIVVFNQDEKNVTITTDNPKHERLLTKLQNLFRDKNIIIAYSLSEDIDACFIHYRKPLETRFIKIIRAQQRVAPEIIEEIIEDALVYRASDIHFEPLEKEVVIRFRIDGVLQEAGRIPKEYYENILNRIKVQAHLRIDEHFTFQDGAIRFIKDTTAIDMRISIAPTLDGEKVVIRLLSIYVRGLTLSDLGLSTFDQKIILKAIKKPFGMILVTGPTGSGKTTTLYSLIKILNQPGVNITTIEDPVEYRIVGVNQIQVNPQADITFAKGLRSIVRQDPDVILVGEIRDEETAEIAVNASLTGHLLLSTFHANDAATAIPRLLDMGIEPFLLASTLEIVIAQRLVRVICEKCRVSYTEKRENLTKFAPNIKDYFPSKIVELHKGEGCEACGRTGYQGRTSILELIQVTKEMRDLILTNPSTKQIWELAKKQGAHSLFEDGMDKVKEGITTIKELLRVGAPPEAKDAYGKKDKI